MVLTSHQGESGLFDATKAGAVSYLHKTAGVEIVVQSERAAALVESVLDSNVVAKVLEEVRKPGGRETVDLLSQWEIEVLTELARGPSNKEIAKNSRSGRSLPKRLESNSPLTNVAIISLTEDRAPIFTR